MGLKLKNLKETIFLLAFAYAVFSIVIILLKLTIKDGESLTWLMIYLSFLFYAAVLCVLVVYFIYSIKKRELFYLPRVRILLFISLIFLIISVIIQIYNPIVMSIATSNSDTGVCNNLIDVYSPLRYLMGPDFFLWSFYKGKCIHDIALKQRDVSICNELGLISGFDETTRVMAIGGCILNLAVVERDVSLCERIDYISTGDNTAKENREVLHTGCLRNFNKSISY